MADNTIIIPLKLSDGKIIEVEVTPIGEQPVSAETRVFQQATGIIKSIAEDVAGTLKDISETVKPDKFSVKLGLQIGVESGELTALIVKGTGTANLEITMEWGK
ncbi:MULTISPECIES: CU044_2847 family protein [Cyanophyceae]|uniref:CU044_2847 family protein n=1 Tax=Cyanophyceae TaxID=3028117 RepID=UPI00232C7C95|nr:MULTISPECIES: CU044_2847 family protein [Cyanophyceae]MDB9356183.1 CU044_2847 family protein [Nodularia spumigena CS-587/03]MDB9316232.1 CU044_2847 family protein [Nodularia spumigena CS-590/01A]MDB9326771.1 CU044_2847 family protein [Nodularia spumigena CS-590/02]MDB9335353.1 CU044_2847 family protein [Nodularia spumigena CS-590/01]MDB9341545.1 CU044_2847 family protein [Nodularia spumigena CS-589/07]